MLFYDIKLNSFPKIKYNCVAATEKYRVDLQKQNDLLELCYVESGEYICKSESGIQICEAGHLYPFIFNEEAEIYSESDKPVRLISVCVQADYELQIIDSELLTENDAQALMKNMLDGDRILIQKDGLSSLQFDWLAPHIKKIVACNCGERVGEEARAISLWFDLTSRITKSCMNLVAYDAKAFPTSAVAYSEMVVSYIIKNYKNKISVADIADEFGLSPNYLHAIFKQVKGITIIDYLTSYRMELAKIYIERFGLRAYEAAAAVGIDDPAYFSRVFKKMFGKSVNSFKKNK